MSTSQDAPPSSSQAPPRRRFVGRSPATATAGPASSSSSSSTTAPLPLNALPQELLQDPLINASIDALLPKNYSFEIHKTIHQIRKFGVTRVALQMPEGLAMFGTSISDLIEMHTDAEAVILADVTYGACCVDDYTARALGCDMLVHYGHSCLIPIDTTSIRCLYVFVEIGVDTSHLLDTVLLNFPSCLEPPPSPRDLQSKPALSIGTDEDEASAKSHSAQAQQCHLAVVGTVQFLNAVHGLKADLEDPVKNSRLRHSARKAITANGESGDLETSSDPAEVNWRITIPQVKPLSPGEILGCTAPKLPADVNGLLYIGDGRFHLESIMIANPTVPAFRYDPYSKKLTREGYEHEEMLALRGEAIATARKSLPDAAASETSERLLSQDTASSTPPAPSPNSNWGVVLGTLGRQGSLSVLKTITSALPLLNTVPILLSELSPAKLAILAPFISTFVQTSCPRLSIDWGYAFPRPLLSTYEASVALGKVASRWTTLLPAGANGVEHGQKTKQAQGPEGHDYPMDFYADMSLGQWTPRWHVGQQELARKRRKEERDKAKAAAAQQQQQQRAMQTTPIISATA